MSVALIVAIAGLLAVLVPLILGLPKLIKEFKALRVSNHAQIEANAIDHAGVIEALNGLTVTVERVDTRLTDHITWHAHAAPTQPNVQSVVVNPVKEEVAA